MATYSIGVFDTTATLTNDIEYILIDGTTNNISLTLPEIGGDGDSYFFKRIDNNILNSTALLTQGLDTIAGITSRTVNIGDGFRIIAYSGDYKIL